MNPALWKHQCRYDCPLKKTRFEESGWDSSMESVVQSFLLARGGYPFEKDDLTREEWIALAVLRDEFEQSRAQTAPQVVIAGAVKKKEAE